MINKSDYDKKIMAHMQHETTYEKQRKNPTAVVGTKIAHFLWNLQEEGVLSKEDYYKVYLSSEIPPSFYDLPKIHKDGAPLRPIVSSCGAPTHKLAKYLVSVLKSLVAKMESFIWNHAEVVRNRVEPK